MSADKKPLLDQLRAKLAADLDAITASQRATAHGATHEESKAENDKDTRAIEASYLARGLAERVSALRRGLATLETFQLRPFATDDVIGLSALVEVEDDDGTGHHYLLAPAGAGVKLDWAGSVVRVVTPESPVGSALIGGRVGDEVELRNPKGRKTAEIVGVR